MMRKTINMIVTAGCCASSSAFTFSSQGEKDEPWNILFILLDDAGWRDVGYAGNEYIETPHIDRLAMEGMRFHTAYSTHPFSAPARQSLLTGQWPARTAWMQRFEIANPDLPRNAPPYSAAGTPGWTHRRPEFVGIAEALNAGGYETAHIGKWHFGIHAHDISPESLGFGLNFGGASMVGAVENFFAPYEGLPGDVEAPPGEYLTDRLTDETIQFIRENRDRPFFVQLWHYAPHTPIQAPESVVEKYRRKRQEIGDDRLNPTYAAMMDVVDQGIGRIVDELERLGLAERTVIFLSSDNGGVRELGSVPVTCMLPLRDEKGFVYQGGVRVPMFVYWPGQIQSGSESDLAVSFVDFYPTMLDLAGIPIPEEQQIDGVSLTPLLQTGQMPQLEDRPLFWYNVTSGLKADGRFYQPVASVLKGDWRLVKNFERPLELYHLETDAGEAVDRSSSHPEKAEELSRLLDEWLTDTGVVTPTTNPRYDPDYIIPRQIDTEELPGEMKLFRQWILDSEGCGWRAARMVNTSFKNGAMRMQAAGNYPVIETTDTGGMNAGVYGVQIELSVPTSGRIRFVWRDVEGTAGVVEVFPQRDGNRHVLTGLFESQADIQALQLAAPTHLQVTGHYDPETQPDYIDVYSIRILSVLAEDEDPGDPGEPPEGEMVFADDFNRPDVPPSSDGGQIGAGYVLETTGTGTFGIKSGRLIPGGGAGAHTSLVHNECKTVNSGGNRFRLSVDITPKAASFNPNLGVVFNWQESGNFYALRIGNRDVNWQFLRFSNWSAPAGRSLAFGSGSFPEELQQDEGYTLSVSSEEPHRFTFEVRRVSDGKVIGSGSAVDDAGLYQDGTGGIYFSNPVFGSPFDDLQLRKQTEPK